MRLVYIIIYFSFYDHIRDISNHVRSHFSRPFKDILHIIGKLVTVLHK